MGLLGQVSQAITGKQRVSFIINNNSVFQFDASMKETHTRESPPTEFPVENGQTISDHIIVKPFQLELVGIISDTPIGGIQGLLTEAGTTLTSALLPPVGVILGGAGYALYSSLSTSPRPSVAAYGQLIKLQENAQPMDVITNLKRYDNMFIKSISVPQEAESGNILYFTVNLVRLNLVSPQSVDITVFANPGLSSNLADLGQNNPDYAADAKRGYIQSYAATASGGPN